MKKVSIFLVKVHRFYYLLLGVLIALIVFSKVQNVKEMIPTADVNPLIPIFIIFGICLIQPIAMAMFYTNEERRAREIERDIGVIGVFVKWDNYFSTKINTELSLGKRWSGYVYAILRPMPYIVSSYLLVAILCLLSNK